MDRFGFAAMMTANTAMCVRVVYVCKKTPAGEA